jgi:hypothetical protein
MTENTSPTFSNKCSILADLWLGYRQEEEFRDFIEYNDLGLPLAYAFSNELAIPTGIAERYIDESYSLLVEALNIPDEIYESLEEMLDTSEN